MTKRDLRSPLWSLWQHFFNDLFHFLSAFGKQISSRRGRWFVVALPFLWLTAFFLVPFILVLKISFANMITGGHPPYSNLFSHADGVINLRIVLSNYVSLLNDHLYVASYINSISFATISTLGCLLVGYPMAYGIARAQSSTRALLLILVILPFWTSSLLRSYALIGILRTNGLLNQLLLWVGVIDTPLEILHTNFAVYIGIIYNYLPFMILPLTANLMRLDFTLLEAAADLGAKPAIAFVRITLPLSIPGMVAGSLLVFIPAIGEFVIPDLLGGPDAITIGRVIWNEFFANRDWPLAATVAIAMLVLIVVPMLLFEYIQNRRITHSLKP